MRRGAAPQQRDYTDYDDAKPELVSRLGRFCSYCERAIATGLAVEHIQDKSTHKALIGRWTNFLLSCVNCNSCKSTKQVDFAKTLLPDRDNSYAAFDYTPDGRIIPSIRLGQAQRKTAASLLALTGLDRRISETKDTNEKLIALDGVSQRMETWLIAEEAERDVSNAPNNQALKKSVTNHAIATGHFSIWMTVFHHHVDIRKRLIDAFPGTRESGCFDPATAEPVRAPNPDALASGGKV